MGKAWMFKWAGSLCNLRYRLLPKSSQAGSTCFTCQKPAFRGDGLGPSVLAKARAWYLTIYFRVGDLTGVIGGWELNLLTLPHSDHRSSYWYLHWRRVHRLWLALGQGWSGY